MSIQSITQQIQDSEQYKIRSPKSEQNQTAQSVQTEQQVPPKTDEYDKTNPVGETVEGIYSVSHDNDGNVKVNYTQPTQKTAGTSQAVSNSSGSDDELEELKKQEEQLKAQLTRETDENVKQTLRAQLQSVEIQIAMKNAGVNS